MREDDAGRDKMPIWRVSQLANTGEVPLGACKRGHFAERDSRGYCIECRRADDRNSYAVEPRRKRKIAQMQDRRKADPTVHEREAASAQKRRDIKPERVMLERARVRARRGGYPCTITIGDIYIPTHCPLLGIRLKKGRGAASPSSPSLDKIAPELGYVPGNIMVISHRANTIKHNATLREVEAIAANWGAIVKEKYPWET